MSLRNHPPVRTMIDAREASKRRRTPLTYSLHISLTRTVNGRIHAWRGVLKASVSSSSWGVGGRRFESDHPDQKKKRVVNTSIETSVNSSFRLTASPRLRDVLNSFIYSSAHKHQGANDFPADLYLEGMKGPPFIS